MRIFVFWKSMKKKGRSKMRTFKKITTLGLAAMMAVSATSVSAFAAEESDPLVASISHDGEAVVEVHESDLDNGEYSVVYDGVTITVGDDENGIAPLSANTVYTGNMTSNGVTNELQTVSSNVSFLYNFDVAKTQVVYTPYYYTPYGSNTTLKYTITGDESYGSKVVATVYLNANGGSSSEVSLYSGPHTVNFSGLAYGDKTYARVYNKTYTSNATGTCAITLN